MKNYYRNRYAMITLGITLIATLICAAIDKNLAVVQLTWGVICSLMMGHFGKLMDKKQERESRRVARRERYYSIGE